MVEALEAGEELKELEELSLRSSIRTGVKDDS